MGRSLEATRYTDGKTITLKKISRQQQAITPGNIKMRLKIFTFTILRLLFQASYHPKDGIFLPRPSGNN